MQNCWDGERTKRPSFPDIINSLNTIILEYCIADSKGRKFWKEQFYNKETKILQEEILWKDFITSWTNKFPLKSNELYSLQAILGKTTIFYSINFSLFLYYKLNQKLTLLKLLHLKNMYF